MSRTLMITLAVLAMFCGMVPIFGSNQKLAYDDIVMPAGTQIPVRLTQGISTRDCRQGELVSSVTAVGVIRNNVVFIPQGTRVTLRVVDVIRGSRSSRPAYLALEAISVGLPSGEKLAVLTSPISKTGTVRSNTAVPAAQVIYSIPGSGGQWRSIATAVANIRTTTASTAIVDDVQMPAGQVLNFVLSAPVAITTHGATHGR